MKPQTQRIINYLKTVEEASMTEIQLKTKVPFYMLRFFLEDMEKNKHITKRIHENGLYVYYKLRKKRRIKDEQDKKNNTDS